MGLCCFKLMDNLAKKKRCWRCKSEKDVSEFGISKYKKDGLIGQCANEYARMFRIRNLEAGRAKDKKYYNMRKDDPAFREKTRNKALRYYYANKESKIAYQGEYEKRKLAINPEFKIEKNLRRRISGLLNKRGWKSARTLELLGCSVGRLMEYLKAHFKPGMTFNNYGRKGWHIDHIKPCKAFDLCDSEQQKACFNWLNLQPLWATENLKKGAKYRG